MLPETVSNNLASLQPGRVRSGLDEGGAREHLPGEADAYLLQRGGIDNEEP